MVNGFTSDNDKYRYKIMPVLIVKIKNLFMRQTMKRISTFFTFLFLTMPVALMARWHGDGFGYCDGYGLGRYFVFGGRGIMMILSIIILVLLIIWAAKALKTGQPNPFKTQDPLTILKARFAKGEISKEEYIEIKKEI